MIKSVAISVGKNLYSRATHGHDSSYVIKHVVDVGSALSLNSNANTEANTKEQL